MPDVTAPSIVPEYDDAPGWPRENLAKEAPAMIDAPLSVTPPLAQPDASLTAPTGTRQITLTRADRSRSGRRTGCCAARLNATPSP